MPELFKTNGAQMTETHFNSDDYEPEKGELRIMDGKLAMYVNSLSYGASSGSRWVIRGNRMRFTLARKTGGYIYAICHELHPKDGTITVEILGQSEGDTTPTGDFQVIPVDEIRRCESERSK